jgi:fatty acid desaturase
VQTATDTPTEDFSLLAQQIREAGLLERRPAYYSVKIGLTLAAYGAGFAGLALIGDSWIALAMAAFLGLMFTQLGFVGHDAGHHEVFRTRRANRLLGLVVGNVLIGMSYGWWVPKHSAHHAHPNEVDRDPDISYGLAPPTAKGETPSMQDRVEGFMWRWQAPLFFPLMILRSTGIYVLGIHRLVQRRDRAAGMEGALLALHAGLYLSCVLLALSPLKRSHSSRSSKPCSRCISAAASHPITRACPLSRPTRASALLIARW